MICTTIQNKDNFDDVLEALSFCEMAEIRLDRCALDEEGISQCFMSDVPLVATCRISELISRGMGESEAVRKSEMLLIKAIVSGAKYVDMEIEAPKHMVKRVCLAAKENGTSVIRSFHDFSGTGTVDLLKGMVEKCRRHGAEIVKIVTTAFSDEDVRKVISLYDCFDPSGLIAFCMGEAGADSRIECLRKGAPFSYAAFSVESKGAPGQWVTSDMCHAVYGGWKFLGFPFEDFSFSEGKCNVVRMPSSKSFAQRAIIAAALAEGVSVLRHYSPCGDNESAIRIAESVGAEISFDGDSIVVKGAGVETVSSRLSEAGVLNVGESGLMTRLMIPLSAALSSNPVVITGEKTLKERTLEGISGIMGEFGVEIACEGDVCRVPLTVQNRMVPCRAEISGKNGSQLISGLLMSLPLCERNSSFIVHDPVSIPYMFITVDVLKKFGIRISDELIGGSDFMLSEGNWDMCSEILFKVKGGQRYAAADLDLEADWSTAANFLVAAAVFGRAELSGLDTGSLQADLSIMDILMDAGASISQFDEEDGNIYVQRSPLRAFSIDASDCPDLFPIISVLAAFCQGTSRITGVGRLSHKESDRGQAILEMLLQMGVNARVADNTLEIEGRPLVQRILTGTLLRGGKYTSRHDHRMAMALTVASLGADSPIEIDDRDCVSKSCPSFFSLFAQMANVS